MENKNFNPKDWQPYHSHEFIPELFDEVRMPDGRYCVVVHDRNISTLFQHPFTQNEIWDEELKTKILNNFGI